MAFNYFKTKLIPADQVIYIYDLVKNIVAPGNRAFVSPQIQIVIDELLDRKFPENWRQDPQFIKSIKESFSKKNFSTYDGTFFPEYYAAYYLIKESKSCVPQITFRQRRFQKELLPRWMHWKKAKPKN